MPTPFDIVFFGGTGDLVMRKLLPALYQAHAAGTLHPGGRIIGLGRRDLGREGYLKKVEESARPHIPNLEAETWHTFCQRINYLPVDAENAEQFHHLAALLGAEAGQNGRALVIYLSTAPHYFMPICRHLAAAGLNRPATRIVLEKPLGHDLASAQSINTAVAAFFREEQIYRIDHYLGKEPVQNLLALRFANRLFEPLWCAAQIRAVEITIAEELGVEKRGEFYDQTGALRDMLQNHLLQLLCFTAMEPPLSLGDSDVRNAKLNVLRALKPFNAYSVRADVVRGQYTAGQIRGENVCGYREEANVAPQSLTETFIALRAEIDNPRWRGVPFLLRSGKRMAGRLAEIVLHFWPEAHPVFGCGGSPNRISVRLQPQESVKLFLQMKAPGTSLCVHEAALDLDLLKIFPERRADAYERLLLDAIDGKLALFMRSDELEAAWRWLQPVLDDWATRQPEPEPYPAGSHAPETAIEMAAACGVDWRNR